MKTTTLAVSALVALAGLAVFAATPVSAACDNYGNQINIGSNWECQYGFNYCDGDAGPAGSGAGAGAGAGAGGTSGSSAGASAGTSTTCDQSNGGGRCAVATPAPEGAYLTRTIMELRRGRSCDSPQRPEPALPVHPEMAL